MIIPTNSPMMEAKQSTVMVTAMAITQMETILMHSLTILTNGKIRMAMELATTVMISQPMERNGLMLMVTEMETIQMGPMEIYS